MKKLFSLSRIWILAISLSFLMFLISSYNQHKEVGTIQIKDGMVAFDGLVWEEAINDFSYTDEPDLLRSDINLVALEDMIADLLTSHPTFLKKGEEYLSELPYYHEKLVLGDSLMHLPESENHHAEILAIFRDILKFQREVALANPVLADFPVLYVVRNQYAVDHHNTETFFHTNEPNIDNYNPGGALKLFNPKSGKSTVLINPGSEGLVRDPEIHFDGQKVVFSMRVAKNQNYSIYELRLDAENNFEIVPDGLSRLTSETEASDIDPLYLPDDRIIFSSTRDIKYCHCNMHIMANLFRMDGDGANIHQISKNTLFDMHASLLPDGRVLYSRWEYVDRNFGDAQGLWTSNPDGTNHAVYWGNNTVSPAAVFDGRLIPGTNHVVSIFGSCHDRPWGALSIIDRNFGIDSEDAVIRIWPESARSLVSIDGSDLPRPFMEDLFMWNMKMRYEDPFPLVDRRTGKGGNYFLVSRSLYPYEKHPNELKTGIYLVDLFGNEILIHQEGPGCFDPMLLAPHQRPPVIPDQRNFTGTSGTMYVMDVYEGTPMQDVKRGDVKYLRVIESTEKRFWTTPISHTVQFITEHNGQVASSTATARPAISWSGYETKRILGTVPVEPDGSAFFELPAETFVYFQLLDKDGKMIASMRSGTMVQPGENFGCVGCHDNRLSAPVWQKPVSALKRPASKLDGWHGPARTFCYMTEVQPVWDKHCVDCHDFGKKAGDVLVLAPDKELVFNASYVELFKNWSYENAFINTLGLGTAPIIPAYAAGSHQSKLIQVLANGHHGVSLSDAEMDRIITWIDIGGPYYAEYGSANPDNVAGRAPLSVDQVRRLEELTSVSILSGRGQHGYPNFLNYDLWISFDRPELSPILNDMENDSPSYHEALTIIREGQQALIANPDADLPGFVLSDEHQVREARYKMLLEREYLRRQAIEEGQKIYDHDFNSPKD